jgi:TnpA family transposase
MPVALLTPDQVARYGCFPADLSLDQLARSAFLDATDRAVLAVLRGDHTRLGYAVQLATVRLLGTFLDAPTAVPSVLVTYLAQQIGIAPTDHLDRYQHSRMRWLHTLDIRRRYDYRDYRDPRRGWRFVRWLFARAWLGNERPSLLFDHAVSWLRAQKVVLPGITVLERDVARVRDRANERLWRLLARDLTPADRQQLDALLIVASGAQFTPFEQLRRLPATPSSQGLLDALAHLDALRDLPLTPVLPRQLGLNRLHSLARVALTARAQTLARLADTRRAATLRAALHVLVALAHDTVLDLLDEVFTSLLGEATKAGTQARVRTLADLDAAALDLADVATILLDPTISDGALRTRVDARLPRATLVLAIAQVRALARPPADMTYDELVARYRRISRFRPRFLATMTLDAVPAGKSVLRAYQYLQQAEGRRSTTLTDAPLQIVTTAWRSYVMTAEQRVDRIGYTYCVLDRLVHALRRREVFVQPSLRYADPRIGLLHGAAWEAARLQVCRALAKPADGATALAQLSAELTTAYQTTAAALPANTAVTMTTTDGHADLVLSPLERLDEPASLTTLRNQVATLMPQVDLPEVLLEVHQRTGFLSAFTHLNEREAFVDELAVSLCAILLADACNIGLAPLISPTIPALREDRLRWVQQHYLRSDTLQRANACLVDAHRQLPLAQRWGSGEVASADGVRFVVPFRTIHAAANPKYFGPERGVTFYNLTADQYSGLHGIVVTGTLRDSLVLLSLLLGQQTPLQPREIMTDTGAYADVIFGLLWLLGYQFSPRISDIGATRFWRIDRTADYGGLNDLAAHRIRPQLIVDHWDDLLRIAGSLTMGACQVESLMRTLQRDAYPTKLARALQELGRIIKTLYLLNYLNDESYRRRILTQLNRGEGRHRLARVVFYGQRGELRQRYREGQEDQLHALGLVVNAIIIWNTMYMQRALAHLRQTGQPVHDADVARLAPLGHAHLNVLGRYTFALHEPITQGAWRPLRTGSEL